MQPTGIHIEINSEIRNFKGSLLLAAGDTSAADWMGGFKMSVSALKLCRGCMTDNISWKSFFNEKDFILRSIENHRNQVKLILDQSLNKKSKQFWQKFYGLNGESPLLDIKDCDITKILDQDMMHIFCEGFWKLRLDLSWNFV